MTDTVDGQSLRQLDEIFWDKPPNNCRMLSIYSHDPLVGGCGILSAAQKWAPVTPSARGLDFLVSKRIDRRAWLAVTLFQTPVPPVAEVTRNSIGRMFLYPPNRINESALKWLAPESDSWRMLGTKLNKTSAEPRLAPPNKSQASILDDFPPPTKCNHFDG